jgi:DNA-binding MarR family transcriptional regulator/GNAT superfamily N-acetyltransferase
VLEEGFLDTPFSLAQGRVLYELAHRDKPTASTLGKDLGLDAGYLSRILRDFRKRGLVARETSSADRRESLLSLTERGHKALVPLNARSQAQVAAMLRALSAAEQTRLVEAIQTVESLLAAKPEPATPYILRPPAPGDLGWIVSRHGALYARDYGWDERLEALVAEIVASFVRRYDPRRERCWIAERAGENVGSVFLVKKSERVAQLRLLLVDPAARGLGIGARLVDECTRFARAAGYRKITLWTHSVLTAARRIYKQAGYELAGSWTHDDFGKTLVAETWELKL